VAQVDILVNKDVTFPSHGFRKRHYCAEKVERLAASIAFAVLKGQIQAGLEEKWWRVEIQAFFRVEKEYGCAPQAALDAGFRFAGKLIGRSNPTRCVFEVLKRE
jgi:hypothetical protein